MVLGSKLPHARALPADTAAARADTGTVPLQRAPRD
jgi:1-deoxy-D-xylulose-5-phosphate synthase